MSRTWSAKWIWNDGAPSRNAWVLFRSEFECGSRAATLYITADTRYRVWINGMLVGDGPPQSQPYHQYYDARDISGAMREGGNSICVVVNHQGVQAAARGGLLAEIVDADGRVISATGPSWRTSLGKAWKSNTLFTGANKIGPFQEHIDMRAIPKGWLDCGYDDSTWLCPEVVSSRGCDAPPNVMPWCRILKRDIDFLELGEAYPVAVQNAEECLDLANRFRAEDLSVSLSQAGRPLDWASIEGADNLCGPDGETVFACSDRHRDMVTDGRYDPCVTMDFGRVLAAYAEIELDAPEGSVVELGYAERLVDGRFNNAIECSFADRVTCAQGVNVFRPLIWRSFRYLRVRLKNCEAGARVRAVRAVTVRYPYEHRGVFSGNARFEAITDICKSTIELCSIESLMDTPFREQAQWLGDVAAVTVPCIYSCFGDVKLPRKFITQAAMNTRPTGLLANISNVASTDWANDIPDYSLWWVMALWRHYEYTGDISIIHECYPEMQRVMRVHLERVGADGLLGQMMGWVFIDWAHIDVKGKCAPYNALFAGACDAASLIASVKGDAWARDLYFKAAADVRAAFFSAFTDPGTGVIADAVDCGKMSERRSEQGNAAAIAFGCVDDRAAARIIDALFEKRTVNAIEAQPFFMVVVLEALRRQGRTDLAIRLIDERWGGRMLDLGRTSCTEEWYENGSWRNGDWQGFERTHSHAWSACAVEFLIKGLAGVEIIKPGCRAVRIRPYRADFPYKTVFPTPLGDIAVCWDGKRATVEAPGGIDIEGL